MISRLAASVVTIHMDLMRAVWKNIICKDTVEGAPHSLSPISALEYVLMIWSRLYRVLILPVARMAMLVAVIVTYNSAPNVRN